MMMNDKKQRLVVLGGGESGVGAAVLGKVKDMEVWLSDAGAISDKYKSVLQEYDIDFEEGDIRLRRYSLPISL